MHLLTDNHRMNKVPEDNHGTRTLTGTTSYSTTTKSALSLTEDPDMINKAMNELLSFHFI